MTRLSKVSVLCVLIFCFSFFKNAQAKDALSTSVVYSSDTTTHLVSYPENSYLRLFQIPLNIMVYSFAHIGPFLYAASAGSLAKLHPEWEALLRNGIPLSQGIATVMALQQFYPALKNKWRDISRYGLSGVAFDRQNYLTCQQRRGNMPVHVESRGLGRHFYFTVHTSDTLSPVLRIKKLSNELNNTKANQLNDDEIFWKQLYETMTTHGSDHISIQVKNSEDKKKSLAVTVNGEKHNTSLTIPIDSNDSTLWDLELINHWCLNIDSDVMYSVFDGKTIEAIVVQMNNALSSSSKKTTTQNHLKPRATHISYSSYRTLSSELGNNQRLVISDYSNKENSGYFYLTNNHLPRKDLLPLVIARDSEQLIEYIAAQDVWNLENIISGTEKLIAQTLVIPETSKSILKAVSHSGQTGHHHDYHKQHYSALSAIESTSFVSKVKSNLIDLLRPVNDAFLRRTALFMMEPEPDKKMIVSDDVEGDTFPSASLTPEQFQIIQYLLTGEGKDKLFQEVSSNGVTVLRLKPEFSEEDSINTLKRLMKSHNIQPSILAEVLVNLEQSDNPVLRRKVQEIMSQSRSGASFLPIMAKKRLSSCTDGAEDEQSVMDTDSALPTKKIKTEKIIQPWGRSQRRIVTDHYRGLGINGKLLPDLFKYQSRSYPGADKKENVKVSQAELIKLSHFKPATPEEKIITKFYLNKKHKNINFDAYIDEEIQKKAGTADAYSEPDISKARKALEVMRDYKKATLTDTTADEVIGLIEKHRLSREQISTHHLKNKDVWKALFKSMPPHAVIRNLGIMSSLYLFVNEGDSAYNLLKSKLSKESIERAKLSPYVLQKALRQYHQGGGNLGKVQWTPDSDVVKTLEDSYLNSLNSGQTNNQKTCFVFGISSADRDNYVDETGTLSFSDAALSIIAPWSLKSGCDSTIVIYSKDDGENYALKMNQNLMKKVTGSLAIMDNLKAHKEEQDRKKLVQAREAESQNKGYETAVQILFLLDTTRSMKGEIKACQQAIKMAVEKTESKLLEIDGIDDRQKVEVAFIGYKDLPRTGYLRKTKRNWFVVNDFTIDTREIQTSVSLQEAEGGSDVPEDIAGAFDQVSQCNWLKTSVKIIFHITDAPPHGCNFHSLSKYDDHYSDGDPDGLDPVKQMEEFAKRHISYSLLDTWQPYSPGCSLKVAFSKFEQGFKNGLKAISQQNPSDTLPKPTIQRKIISKHSVTNELPRQVDNIVTRELQSNSQFLKEISVANVFKDTYGNDRIDDEVDENASFIAVPVQHNSYSSLAALEQAINNRITFDQFVIFIDGHYQSIPEIKYLLEKMKEYREAVNNKARLIVAMHSTNKKLNEQFDSLFKEIDHVLFIPKFTEHLSAISDYWNQVPVAEESLEALIDEAMIVGSDSDHEDNYDHENGSDYGDHSDYEYYSDYE